MRNQTVGELGEKICKLFLEEVSPKLQQMKVDETRDGLRIIFEFEFGTEPIHQMTPLFTRNIIHDAVEIRHRRP